MAHSLKQGIKTSLTMKLESLGVTVGAEPPADVIVSDDSIFSNIAFRGSLAIGETYVGRGWDSPNLLDVLVRGIPMGIPTGSFNLVYEILKLQHLLFNPQSKRNAQKIANHYNTDNTLYERQLGEDMSYTCAYFGRNAQTLKDGQRDKKQIICEKINLLPGQHVLDIGCGFGSFAEFAARQRGAKVTGITISDQQLLYGRERCQGLDGVELLFLNYLDLLKTFKPNTFDHIVSIGMFEHVGPKNYDRFMEIAHILLKPEGFFLLHTIGGDGFEAWINKYIFPGGVLPNESQITDAIHGRFGIKDWHVFGPDYARTLHFWRENFIAAWPELQLSGKFGKTPEERDRFYRMWIYYLTSCEAAFTVRETELWQILLAPKGSTTPTPRVR